MKNPELLALTNRIAKDMTSLASRLVPEMEKMAKDADPKQAKKIQKALKDSGLAGHFKELERQKADLYSKIKNYK